MWLLIGGSDLASRKYHDLVLAPLSKPQYILLFPLPYHSSNIPYNNDDHKTNNHSLANSQIMPTPTTSPAAAPRRQPGLKELMFRSTIYNRHEARRAQTLLRKNDPRPAWLRVLVPSGAAAAIAAVEQKSTASSTLATPQQQQQQQPVMVQDESVFSLHHGATEANMTSVQRQQQRHPLPSSPSTAALAAAAGAVFSEAMYGARCLRQASPFATAVSRVPTAHVTVNPEHAALTVQHTWRLVPQQGSSTLGTVSHAQLLSRAAPVALLFGTKTAAEHVVLQNDQATPPAAISILSAAAAGTVLGSLRCVFLSNPAVAMTVVGREVAGATLYFSAYDGARYLLVRGGNMDHHALHPVATATAGALAGVVYDSVRVCRQLPLTAAATTTTTTTRSLADVVVRSAPSHALLFLGYEATRRLVQG